jgi:hypothetical protein
MSRSILSLSDRELEELRVRLERTIIGSSKGLEEVFEELARRQAGWDRIETDSAAPQGAAGPQ